MSRSETNQEGLAAAGRAEMRPLDRRNSPNPGRILACAQWKERRRNWDVNTPLTRGLWPSRAPCSLDLGTGLAAAPKMRFALQLFFLLLSQVLQNQSCWKPSSPTFLPQASGGAKSQIIPEPGREMKCPHPSNDVLYPRHLLSGQQSLGTPPAPLCPKGLCWKGPLKVCCHTRPGLCFWIYNPGIS